MSDENPSFDEFDTSELSEEDLKILQAFEAMDTWSTAQSHPETNRQVGTSRVPEALSPLENEEMLLIFAAEAEGDITSIRQILNQLLQHEQENLTRFVTLKRLGHKLHGTAGAVGFPLISTIAAQVELLAEEVSHGTISPSIGAEAISATTTALEACLETITSMRREPDATLFLASLEAAYQNLDIDLQQFERMRTATNQINSRVEKFSSSASQMRSQSEQIAQDKEVQELSARERVIPPVHISPEELQQGSPSISSIPFIHVDARRFEHLVVCTEKLLEHCAILEDAETQVECALQELYIAQARLQGLEPLIARLQKGENTSPPPLSESIPASSLIARILHESLPHNQRYQHQKRSNSLSKATRLPTLEKTNTNPYLVSHSQWDELEMDRYNEQDILIHALKDAIADIAITTANVQSAFMHSALIHQECMSSVTRVHRDTLLLGRTTFATIVPRLERVVKMSAPGQAQQIRFAVTGEGTEIDQAILNALVTPLVQLLRTCLADPTMLEEMGGASPAPTTPGEKGSPLPPHVWLKVMDHGNRLTFEIGFSMSIKGGAIEIIRQPIRQLQGTISLQRNSVGGISFFLHVPHTHSRVFCLLVRVGDQYLLIPFNQIQCISDGQQEQTDVRYSLQELLGFPGTNSGAEPRKSTSQILPLLILSSEDETTERGTVSIIVDEILGEQECIVNPLPVYLQRPGIAGTTVDGQGRILLMVDLLALIRSAPQYTSSHRTPDNPVPQPHQAKILITDDSAALRHSLIQTLQHASYTVFEAHDGVDGLEKLQRYKPDICLLDIEMPNLNGYDVLQMMSTNPTLASVRVIMLTSRGATKYMQRAVELGARAYLTKPCTQDDLFQTIERVLKE